MFAPVCHSTPLCVGATARWRVQVAGFKFNILRDRKSATGYVGIKNLGWVVPCSFNIVPALLG